jgi:hypothetical protein
MAIIGTLFSVVGGLGSLICLVMVLVKMFPAEGALKGILAIICTLYAYIWGWINAGRFGLSNIMLAWTGCIVLAIIGSMIGSIGAASSLEGFNFEAMPQLVSVVTQVLALF